MGARNVPEGVGAGQKRKPESQRDTGITDTECGNAGGQYDTAASAENKPERANELCGKFAL